MSWKQAPLHINLIYSVPPQPPSKKQREMLLLFSKTHHLGSGAWFVIVIRCSLTYSLKTWSFWILIKHQGTSQGLLAWQRKLVWFTPHFVVDAKSLPLMRDRRLMDKKHRTIICFYFGFSK